MQEMEDLQNDVDRIRKDRKRDQKKLARKRKFMLNKPFCQTPFYQCYPASSQGFFCCHWPVKPDTPKDPKVIEAKARSLNLQWNTENFNGAIVDKYETWIRGRVRANSEWKKVRNCDWLPNTYFILFHNRTKRIVKTSASALSSETFYQFKTRAHNPGGWSEFTAISEWARTESIGYFGETRAFKRTSIPGLLNTVASKDGYIGMLKLIKGNPYNLDLLVGALKYIISNCESFNNKAIPEEGYYDEWGYYHYPTEVTDDGTENRDDILSKLLENKCAEIILERLKYHPKAEEFNGLSMKLLGILCNFNNLTRRHVVHLGGIDIANKAVETFGGHWKSGVGVAKDALWARKQMQSTMTEQEASLIVQKYVRKMRARKYLEKLREAKAIDKLAEEDKNYDPIWS